MSIVTKKLHSSRGASLMLAMIFMFLCLFIGGSVLAAATANGGRVANAAADQQTYLSQRSAALLMADMLKGTAEAPLHLTIKHVTTTTPAENEGTSTTNTVVSYTLTSSSPLVERSNLQRILVENAVRKYRAAHSNSEKWTESFTGFCFPGFSTYDTNTSHLYTPSLSDIIGNSYSASFTITEPAIGGEGAVARSLTAVFSTTEPIEQADLSSNLFDLTIRFQEGVEEDGETALSLLSLYMKASYSESEPVVITAGGITTTTVTTVIRWDDPTIQKGGA